ncbi:MAG: bacterial ammonia monooxygenase, subunit AmoB, partial [Thiotrichaceae bacterium]
MNTRTFFISENRLILIKKIVMPMMISILVCLSLSGSVLAHGERSQEPFLRMRTIQWYDVTWSKEKLEVNDEIIVSGRFRVSPYWPAAAAEPETAFLNISVPGPVFVRTGSFVNGVNMVNSTAFELGRDYEWEVHLKARRPGRWHVHTMLNVKDAGPIIGPGKFVEVTGDPADFINEVKSITGDVINLDDYGLKNNIFWHSLWAILGLVWLIYWFRRPVFFKRYREINAGRLDGLITRSDRIVATIMLVLSLSITFVGYKLAEYRWPTTLALQSARQNVEPLPVSEQKVDVKLVKGFYRIPGREMSLKLEVTNNTESPVRLGEFTTATVRFINHSVGFMDETAENYPEHLMAEAGLIIDDETPIAPGETRLIKIVAQDAAWETERLASLIYDP